MICNLTKGKYLGEQNIKFIDTEGNNKKTVQKCIENQDR